MNNTEKGELKSYIDSVAMEKGVVNHNVDMDLFRSQVKDELMNRIQQVAAERMQAGAVR